MTTDLVKVVEQILKESMTQIEFLINNSKKINKLSGGAVNLNKLNDFRSAITIVYVAGQNKGILEKTPLDVIYQLLDKGVINETMLDSQIYIMNLKKELA